MSIIQSIFEKAGNIIFVQTDHIQGEVIGTIIGDLYEAGAFNVQVIPSITKKNRPGYLFFIDTAPGNNLKIESIIIDELGATGWHQLQSNHRHVATEIWRKEVSFDTTEGLFQFPVLIKVIKEKPEIMRPEHSSCLALREALHKKGVNLSLNEISRRIIQQVTVSLRR